MSIACDFRSDTITLPTSEMLQAILRAPLGDAGRGDDPTVNKLEALGRELTGFDDALFLPSATASNLSALMAHDTRGGEVLLEETSHIFVREGGGLSAVAGALPRCLQWRNGIVDPERIRGLIKGQSYPGTPPTRLICIENTHNAAGGTVTPLDTLSSLYEVASKAGVAVHMDGARLFNAATYLGVAVKELCRYSDSVTLALSKGLCAPVGALLAGRKDFINKARRAGKMLGYSMRQAGVIAAPAIVALQDPYPLLAQDHRRARNLAEGLASIDSRMVALEFVQTNIVNCRTSHFARDAQDVARELGAYGVRALGEGSVVRFVTHSGIDDDAVTRAIDAMRHIAALPRA